jgi:integrase
MTKYGQPWARDDDPAAITKEFVKLLKKLGINGRKGLGFYTLRHCCRTVADESKDQPACDYIMGHEIPHMSAVYRETISDARLRAVADYVRAWLFPPTRDNPKSEAKGEAEGGDAEGGAS